MVTAQIGGETLEADAFVLTGGSWSPCLARCIGLRLPIYPVKGYSITLPATEKHQTPQSTLLDETFKVAITRPGDRVRVGGMAELAGFDRRLHPKRQRTLERSAFSLFPALSSASERSFWCGHRPMTPDSVPLVGPTRFRNLWLNTGHGTPGWIMSCGSARLIADSLSGQAPAIPLPDPCRTALRPRRVRPAGSPGSCGSRDSPMRRSGRKGCDRHPHRQYRP